MYTPPPLPIFAPILLAAYDDNTPMAEQVSLRLHVLEILSEKNHAYNVHYLVPCLHDAVPEVRNAAMGYLTLVIRKMRSRRAFQRAMRPLQLSPERLDELEKQFKPTDRLTILALASFSRSGYTRQRAVASLLEYNAFDSLPYLLWRVGDCVPKVRREAVAAISSLLSDKNTGCFLYHIELVQGLYSSARPMGSRLYRYIAKLLLSTSPDILFDMVKNNSRRRRLLLQLFGQFRVHQEWVKQRVLGDSDYSVRSLVFQLPSWYKGIKISGLISPLSRDPHPGIRYVALAKHSKKFFMARTRIQFHLADPSQAVRRLARRLLRPKDLQILGIFPPAVTLHDFGLKKYNRLACWLLGMTEIPSFCSVAAALVMEYIFHEDPAVQYAALRGMDLLSMPDATRYALHYLGSPTRRLRYRAAKILARTGHEEDVVRARCDFANAPTSLKLGVLKFFNLVGGQQAREDLVRALSDGNETVRRAAFRHLLSRFGFKFWEHPVLAPYPRPLSIDEQWRKHLAKYGDWAREFTDNRSVNIDSLFPPVHEKLPWEGTQAEFITFVLLYTEVGAFRNEKGNIGPDGVGNILLEVFDVDLSPYPDFASLRKAVPPSADPVMAGNKVSEEVENAKNVNSALAESGIAPSRETQLVTMAALALALDFRRRLSPYINFPRDAEGNFL